MNIPTLRLWYGTAGDDAKNRMLHEKAAPRLRVALAKLEALGTPDTVATFLEDQGVMGKVGNSTACPVAVWLTREIGYAARVASTVSIPWEGATTVADCPEPVRDFYMRFDAGFYPALHYPDAWGRRPVPVTA